MKNKQRFKPIQLIRIWFILGFLMLGLSVLIEAQTTTSVPNVVGLNRAIAQSEIIAAGLVIGLVTPTNNTDIPTGRIISQSPASGASVLTGSAVRLEISAGPAAFVVPKVVGLAQADAQTEITAADLIVGTVTQTVNPTVPRGSVVSQNPTAGTLMLEGTAVNIIVSAGPP
jgi:beta-lactam-binding protein with PASTA domain